MNGWFLNKTGSIYECYDKNKMINGELFLNSTKISIQNYLNLLSRNSFNDEIWSFAINKLKHVCNNCKEIKSFN